MKTMIDLFRKAAADYNENIWILRNDPVAAECFGAAQLYSMCNDLKIRLTAIQDCAESIGAEYFYNIDDEGYISKIYARTQHTACAVEYDREAQKFVPIPYDPWKSLDN